MSQGGVQAERDDLPPPSYQQASHSEKEGSRVRVVVPWVLSGRPGGLDGGEALGPTLWGWALMVGEVRWSEPFSNGKEGSATNTRCVFRVVTSAPHNQWAGLFTRTALNATEGSRIREMQEPASCHECNSNSKPGAQWTKSNKEQNGCETRKTSYI